MICFTSIDDHLFFWFNININSYINIRSVYCSKGWYAEKEMD